MNVFLTVPAGKNILFPLSPTDRFIRRTRLHYLSPYLLDAFRKTSAESCRSDLLVTSGRAPSLATHAPVGVRSTNPCRKSGYLLTEQLTPKTHRIGKIDWTLRRASELSHFSQ
jgi:hypothetical protein